MKTFRSYDRAHGGGASALVPPQPEGPSFVMPGVESAATRPLTTTLRRMSETLQRDPYDTATVSTDIPPGGAFDLIVELKRQRDEVKAARAAEEQNPEGHEVQEQEAQRLFLQSLLEDDPYIVFELLVQYLEAKQRGV